MQNSGGYRPSQVQHHQNAGNAPPSGGQQQQQVHYSNQVRNAQRMPQARYQTQGVYVAAGNQQSSFIQTTVPTYINYQQPVQQMFYPPAYNPPYVQAIPRQAYYTAYQAPQQQNASMAGMPHQYTARVAPALQVHPGQMIVNHGTGVASIPNHGGPGQQQPSQIPQTTGQNQSQTPVQTQPASQVPLGQPTAPQPSAPQHALSTNHGPSYGRLNDANTGINPGNARMADSNLSQVAAHTVPVMGLKDTETGTAKRRKKNLLAITDPVTGKNVIEESSSATPEVAEPPASVNVTENVEAPGAGGSDSTNSQRSAVPASDGAAAPAAALLKQEFYNKISQANDTQKSKPEENTSGDKVSNEAVRSDHIPPEDSSTIVPKDPVVTPGPIPVKENITVEQALQEAAKEETPELDSVNGNIVKSELKEPHSTEKTAQPSNESIGSTLSSSIAEQKKSEVEEQIEDKSPDLSESLAAMVVSEEDNDLNGEVAAISGNLQKTEENHVDVVTPVMTNGGLDKYDEEEKDMVPLSDSHDMSTVSISPVPMDEYCDNNGEESNISDSYMEEGNLANPGTVADENDLDENEIEDGEISEEKEINSDDRVEGNGEADNAKLRVRRYRRDELLAISNSPAAKKKVDIPVSEVMKDARSNNNDKMGNYNMGIRQQPNRGMAGPGRGGRMPPISPMMGMHPGMRWGIGHPLPVPPPAPGQPVPVRTLTLAREKVELNKAENAWKPSRAQARTGKDTAKSPDEIKTDEVVKQTRGILNKLTPENFEKLVHKFMQLELNDRDERIKAVISVVFEKAIDEPNFAPSYARMVQHVCRNSAITAKKFRKEILDKCQAEFTKTTTEEADLKQLEEELAKAPEDKKENLKLELEEKRFAVRRRSLGNVRFIGELFKLQMLTAKIMVECVNMLLGSGDEESYECLCKLLTTVGELLESQLKDLTQRAATAPPNQLPKFIPEKNWMNTKFNVLKDLSGNTKLSSRIRFALLDVVELKENGWKPRRDSNAPKTIEEVRRDAARQEQEEKFRIHQLPEAQGHQRRSSPGVGGMGNMGSTAKKGDWAVQSNKSARFAQVLQKKQEPTSSSPVLAPSMSGWGQGPQNFGRPNSTYIKPNTPPRLQQQQQSQMSRQSNEMGPGRLGSYNSQPPPSVHNSSADSIHLGPSPASGLPTPQLFPRPTPPSSLPVAPSPPVVPSSQVPPKPTLTPKSGEDENETVKNILGEYTHTRIYDDTEYWVNERFGGDRMKVFVDLTARRVAESSKDQDQRGAGELISKLIKSVKVELTQEVVLEAISNGVVQEIPDIKCDSPKVALYVATFVVEIFMKESNLNWLVALIEPLNNEDFKDECDEFIIAALNVMKMRYNDAHVKSLWEQTEGKEKLLTSEGLEWLTESKSTLIQKMIPVLKNSDDKALGALKEQYDLRVPEVNSALVLAICEVSYTGPGWDNSKLESCLPLLSNSSTPNAWKAAKEFIESKKVSKGDEQQLWDRFRNLKLVHDKDR